MIYSPDVATFSPEETRDMGKYSTGQVAAKVGIDKSTLLRWLQTGKLKEPERVATGKHGFRLWSDADVKRVQKFKQKFYWQGRGKKKA